MKGDLDKLRAQREARYEAAAKPARKRRVNRNAVNRNACLRCGTAIEQKTGEKGHRPKEFCSPACKQKAYRERQR